MLKVAHRINTLKGLRKVPKEYGVEIDLRNDGKNIILHHDPFKEGELFETYCREYRHGLMVLNVKTDGIEDRILHILNKYEIKDYFFLDITLPAVLKLSKKGETNIAARFSEFEPLEIALTIKDKIKWVWIDTFTKLPITKKNYLKIKKAGLKTILVGPDRWNREHDIGKYSNFLKKNHINIDAVMSSLELLRKWG